MPEQRKCDKCKRTVTATEAQAAQKLLVQLAPEELTAKQAADWASTTFKSICYLCAEDKMRDASA